MYVTGLEMQGTASLVLLTLVGEVALDDVERLGHALVAMCGNDRARLHSEMQHYRTERVVRVADRQPNIALTREGKTVCLQLTFEDLLIDHCLAPGLGDELCVSDLKVWCRVLLATRGRNSWVLAMFRLRGHKSS